jgi:hypothetical protein
VKRVNENMSSGRIARNRPKNGVFVRNKLFPEYLWCWVSLTNTEDFN